MELQKPRGWAEEVYEFTHAIVHRGHRLTPVKFVDRDLNCLGYKVEVEWPFGGDITGIHADRYFSTMQEALELGKASVEESIEKWTADGENLRRMYQTLTTA